MVIPRDLESSNITLLLTGKLLSFSSIDGVVANKDHRSVERFQGQNHIHFGLGDNYVTLPIIP